MRGGSTVKQTTKDRVVGVLDRIQTILKCGGPGGTPGPCPSSGPSFGNAKHPHYEKLQQSRRDLTTIASNLADVKHTGNYEKLHQARRDLTRVASDLEGNKHPAAKHAENLVDLARHHIFKVEPNHDIKTAAQVAEAFVDSARHHIFNVHA